MKQHGGKVNIRYLVLIVVTIILMLFIVIPVLWFVLVSLQSASRPATASPFSNLTLTLENYRNVFTRLKYLRFFSNSLIISVVATAVTLVIGSLASYSFSRMRNKVTDNLSFWILSTRMLPPIAVIIPIYLLMSSLGLLDTFLGMILIYMTISIPYSVWMMKSFFDDIPRELDEAAMVDGCSKLRILARIVVPIAIPGIVSTGIFNFILLWSEFLFALIITSIDTKTLPVAIAAFITDKGIEWSNMAAAGSVLILPLAVMFYFIQRFLIRGLTFGVIKG
jgi:multiple sugar transport system permease protein